MSPVVMAAIIAGCFGVVTLIGTVVAQIIGFRSTRASTEGQINATHQDTADTLKQQREQLDTTLKAQSEQLKQTLAEQRARTLNERFATAADNLGSDKPPAVRLAGVYAMAGLADDWPENRQTCVDVLCAYLRLPYEPDPGDNAPTEKQLDFHASREVRHTVIRVITAHLKDGAAVSWQGLYFDFTGVVFDGGDFEGAIFSGGTVDFSSAVFSGGFFQRSEVVSFRAAKFSGAKVDFSARFPDGKVDFSSAEFSGGEVSFWADFSGSMVDFTDAAFSGGTVSFTVGFIGGRVFFVGAAFSGGTVSFENAEFNGGEVDFTDAKFSRGKVSFGAATFTGSTVTFENAEFSGGEVDFSNPGDWSVPPMFPWTGNLPLGVKLPKKKDQSQV
jgi:uncharacterized protein YjbI with pentapeptide repeats